MWAHIWALIWALHGQPIWYPHGFCKRYFDGPHVGFNVGPTWATRGPIWVPYGNSTWDPYLYNINRFIFNCILIFLIELLKLINTKTFASLFDGYHSCRENINQ